MGLTSTEFLFLLPPAVLLYYLVPRRVRHYFLLIINLLFCYTFGYMCVVVVAGQALLTWATALLITHSEGKSKKFWASAGTVLLIGVIAFFKVGGKLSTSIIAPLGISFYTLQAVSYIVDVYRGKVSADRNPLHILTYMSFFPTITSGPIYRYANFGTTLYSNADNLRPDYYRITNGIIYMLYGYFLKLVIAERIAIPVNTVFESFKAESYGGIILAIIAAGYSIQIFADFSGYSAIVIGIAQILGYMVPANFSAPYLSMSIKEFWGRWHISLSIWLRDYIYIPLGGNRKGKARKYLNVLLTFLVSGLWHGLAWHFVAWGGLHGFYQIFGDMTFKIRQKVLGHIGIVEGSAFHRLLKRIITFTLVTVAWIFFRVGLKDALQYIYQMVTTGNFGGMIGGDFWNLGLQPFWWMLLIMCMVFVAVVDHLQYRGKRIDEVLQSQGALARGLFVIVIALVILIFGVYGDQHDASYFVYRDF